MSDALLAGAVAECRGCGTELDPSRLSCPACGKLVHGARLQALAAEAEAAEGTSDLTGALHAWSTARTLLPADSRQYAAITSRMEALSRRVDAGESRRPAAARAKKPSDGGKKAGVGATLVLLLAKFKTVIFLVLAKAKFLALGLSKVGTLLSMFAYVGFAWRIWGWQLGLGLVACLYVHEMGHVWELRRYGIRAGAPFFVPGLGAFVALRDHPVSPRVDARIGLAGPVWGFGANLAAYAVYLATGSRVWLAIASIDAMIHLFNLVPVWQLDGSRGFNAMSRRQRWGMVGVLAALLFTTGVSWVGIALAVAAWRAVSAATAPREDDWRAFATYAVLAVCFAAMAPGGPLGLTR